jgi:hypothetical protein
MMTAIWQPCPAIGCNHRQSNRSSSQPHQTFSQRLHSTLLQLDPPHILLIEESHCCQLAENFAK